MEYYYISNSKMEKQVQNRFARAWTKQSIHFLERYKMRAQEIEEETIKQSLLKRDGNKIGFYEIVSKDDLPKSLQKLKFQSVHIKEKDIAKAVKILNKENRGPQEVNIRSKLKQQGELMLLSEIYQHLEEPDYQFKDSSHPVQKVQEVCNELELWEKNAQARKAVTEAGKWGKQTESKEDEPLQGLNQLTDGCDYKSWVERGLGIIEMSHASESNLMSRFVLIENSSKLLKKDLSDRKKEVHEQINQNTQALFETRKQHHELFSHRTNLLKCQKQMNEDKEETAKIIYKSTMNIKDKLSEMKLGNTNKLCKNSDSIDLKKKQIEGLESKISNLEQELSKILDAETVYYKITLKNGTDCRETGLAWIIRKLQDCVQDFECPAYLDKRSRAFMIVKAANDEELENLLEDKRNFINEIGKASVPQRKRKSSLLNSQLLQQIGSVDKVAEVSQDAPIPKRYRKSIRQCNILNEEYIKNSSLMELDIFKKPIEISANLEGMTNRQIYQSISEKIKKIDLQKLRKDRIGNKKKKLHEYQSLLEKIKAVHIKTEELDIQHENHLLSAYKDNKDLYFLHAAACFGYKKAYSMIIKHFSWKSYRDQ